MTDTPRTVLIVEDDNLLLVTLTHQFEEAGYRVVSAPNGEDGVTRFFDEKPTVVVADVMMPKKDGITMLEEIRAKVPTDRTPFIFLSNANDMDYVARAMGNDAVAYLLKSDRQLESIVKIVEEKLKKG